MAKVYNYKRTQFIAIGAVGLLALFLYTRNVTGLVKPAEGNGKASGRDAVASRAQPGSMPMAASNMPAGHQLSIEQVSALAKQELSADMQKTITTLEKEYSRATGVQKTALATQLAQKWEDVEQPGASAMYLEAAAAAQKKTEAYVQAGNRFVKAYDLSSDTLMQPGFLQHANLNFEKALKMDTGNLEAKIGLGTTIVNGMGTPMSGIAILRQVIARDPGNVKANMQLGIFSLKSGQFGKAVERFNTVLEKQKTADVYFYLGTAYESLNQNKEAVQAYSASRKIAGNKKLDDFLDRKIAELQQKM